MSINLFETVNEVVSYIDERTRSYSGRSMYGDNCIGVTTDSSPFGFTARMIEGAMKYYGKDSEEFEAIIALMKKTNFDSMGMSSIYYWPSVKWEGPDCDEDEDEDNY